MGTKRMNVNYYLSRDLDSGQTRYSSISSSKGFAAAEFVGEHVKAAV
jgi:hypothetical protein